jgi:uncharacterized protein
MQNLRKINKQLMRKYPLILLISALSVMTTMAQTVDLRKKIEVTGTAERSLIPDQIFLRITLQEYKSGSRIVPMDKLEEELVKALKKLDIPEDQLTVDNMYGYNWDWRKKRPDEFLASKSFRLQVQNLKKINDLVEYLTPEGVQSIAIAEVKHSKEDEIKEELAKEALQQARERAGSLLAAIDEQLGGVLEINQTYYNNPMPQQAMYEMQQSKAADYSSDIEFKNIDIKVEIRTVFEIK